jgi:hypothetical protein
MISRRESENRRPLCAITALQARISPASPRCRPSTDQHLQKRVTHKCPDLARTPRELCTVAALTEFLRTPQNNQLLPNFKNAQSDFFDAVAAIPERKA